MEVKEAPTVREHRDLDSHTVDTLTSPAHASTTTNVYDRIDARFEAILQDIQILMEMMRSGKMSNQLHVPAVTPEPVDVNLTVDPTTSVTVCAPAIVDLSLSSDTSAMPTVLVLPPEPEPPIVLLSEPTTAVPPTPADSELHPNTGSLASANTRVNYAGIRTATGNGHSDVTLAPTFAPLGQNDNLRLIHHHALATAAVLSLLFDFTGVNLFPFDPGGITV